MHEDARTENPCHGEILVPGIKQKLHIYIWKYSNKRTTLKFEVNIQYHITNITI